MPLNRHGLLTHVCVVQSVVVVEVEVEAVVGVAVLVVLGRGLELCYEKRRNKCYDM